MKIPSTAELRVRLNDFRDQQPVGGYTRLAKETGLDIFWISKVSQGVIKEAGLDKSKALAEAMDREEAES